MKKALSILLITILMLSALPFVTVSAAESGKPSGFSTDAGLYVHAVSSSADGEAWQKWQSVHDKSLYQPNPSEKYFFLPSSADKETIDVFNGYGDTVTVNGVDIASQSTAAVPYSTDESYSVLADGASYTLRVMRSGAEAAVYINNSNADGNGTDLMSYLNDDKSRSAKATGAIVTPDGKVDNTAIKKIKGRGNTSWGKPKKGYNITYDKKVSIAGMEKNKKYSILANFQDDSLARNRILYDLSDAVGMPYASDSRAVDFYVNGFYWGSYQMCEKVEAGSLVPEVDDEGYLNEDGSLKDDFSFIAEIDASAGDGDYYISTKKLKLTIKSPELEADQPYYEEVKAYVKSKFDAFYDATYSSREKLSDYADVASVTKLYLINELGKNWDSGVSSTFFTYRQDENGTYKFYGSPVWDYDNSLGNATGVSRDLRNIGVTDYEKPTGWWCRCKETPKGTKTPTNIMARIALNAEVQEAAPKIWFEEFIPALYHFTGVFPSNKLENELYTVDEYRSLLRDSAAMNYTSGWLLNTGSWIADHTKLNMLTFSVDENGVTLQSSAETYDRNDYDDMFDYAVDWCRSRAAWLSAQYGDSYAFAFVTMGDADCDDGVSVSDVTDTQKISAEVISPDKRTLFACDVNGDGAVDITDATCIQKYIAELDGAGVTGKRFWVW
nr:CotH kinase family protein [uncultured Ruminococcus sp.]